VGPGILEGAKVVEKTSATGVWWKRRYFGDISPFLGTYFFHSNKR